MKTIKEILIKRDDMSEEDANSLIEEARTDFHNQLSQGKMPTDICEEYFGLEPDYIFELM